MAQFTNVVQKQLYPVVAKALDSNSKKWIANIGKFITDRHDELFEIAPYDRIYFNQKDVDALFNSLGITEKQVIDIIQDAYFWNIPINPGCVKEPYIEVMICVIRYYLKKKMQREAELSTIYMIFSGKIYASLHSKFWKVAPPRKSKEVMDYVVNIMLTDKYDLKKEGSVFGAMKKLAQTYIEKYKTKIVAEDNDDDDYKGYIQQLRDRVSSFLLNIATLYYEAYENKLYLNSETDSLNPDEFRITDNDAAMASRITENTINLLTSQKVSLDICNKCKNENVKAMELKDIVESLLSNKDNLPKIRRLLNIVICDFMENNRGKRVGSVEFIEYSLKAKPHSKNPLINEAKDIIYGWLDENSPLFRKRKSRLATANNYYRSLLGYFVLCICKAANK